jgi:hypothetical protein
MKRVEVATNLASALFDAESAIETALAKLGALSQALPEARTRSGLAATEGQAAFEALIASMSGQTSYRSVMVGGGEKSEGPVKPPLALVG